MLNGVRIYTADTVWRQILIDFGASVVDAPDISALNFDDLCPDTPISAVELKSLVLQASDNDRILSQIFGKRVSLPRLQAQIVVLLYQTGGMTMSELKTALGYAPGVATHTIDTAIYQLRKQYGRGFILNTNGVYRLGKL